MKKIFIGLSFLLISPCIANAADFLNSNNQQKSKYLRYKNEQNQNTNQNESSFKMNSQNQSQNFNNNSQINNSFLTKNLERKINNSAQINKGRGGYFVFTTNDYNVKDNKEQSEKDNFFKKDNTLTDSKTARRRFLFDRPNNNENKYGRLNNQNNQINAMKKQISDFDVQNYVGLSFSNSIRSELKSSSQYGATNENIMPVAPFQKSYGFSIVFGDQLFTNIQSRVSKNSQSYKTANNRILFKNTNQNSSSNSSIEKILSAYTNFKQGVRDILGDDIIFAEYSLNYLLNKYKETTGITGAADIDKNLSGIYLGAKLVYMPKLLSNSISYGRFNLPFAGYIFPELGYGTFTYKNTINYYSGSQVFTKKTNNFVYGLGGGVAFDLKYLVQSSRSIFVKLDLKYLTINNIKNAQSGSNQALTENLKYSNTSFNVTLSLPI